MKIRSRLFLLFLALGFMVASASAQDFYWNSASTQSLALGGVYVPSSSDAIGALSTNPAGLTYLTRPSLDLSMSTVFARGSFTNSVNNDAPMTTSPGVIPYGAFGMPIGHSRFSFGVGFAPDLASVSDWHYVDAPGYAGVTYGMQLQKSAILAGRAMAGFSVALSHKLSIGATVGSDYNSNTLQAPYIFQSQPALAGAKVLLDLHTYGVGWNTSVGVLYEPTKNWDLGAAWKSHTVIVTNGLAGGDASALFGALEVSAPSTFTYNAQVTNVLPQSVEGSVAWHVNPRWLVAFQTDWVNWGGAFVNLPVKLTNGSNATINSVAGSTTLYDGIPSALERPVLIPRWRRAIADRKRFAAVRIRPREQSGSQRHIDPANRRHHDRPAFHRHHLPPRTLSVRRHVYIRSDVPRPGAAERSALRRIQQQHGACRIAGPYARLLDPILGSARSTAARPYEETGETAATVFPVPFPAAYREWNCDCNPRGLL